MAGSTKHLAHFHGQSGRPIFMNFGQRTDAQPSNQSNNWSDRQ